MDSSQHLEVEIKFALKNHQETLAFLQIHGQFLKESFQKDIYYLPAHQNYLAEKPLTKRLRIRESDKGNSINYKDWAIKNGEDQDYCNEYEIEIDSVEDAKKIFGVLDIAPLVEVSKHRKTFTYKDIEVAVDEVDNLGRFIEFEAKGLFPSIEEARAYLYALAREMGTQLDVQDKKGYPYVLLERKGLLA